MSDYDCDLFIIGGGSGGVRAARMAAQRGASVMLAEGAALGGTCVNLGCIPKKLYSYAAHYADDFKEARGFGWQVEQPRFDWAMLKANRAGEIARLNGVYTGMLQNAGVQVHHAWARLLGAHSVQLEQAGQVRRFSARHILVATGGSPAVPGFPGGKHVITSDGVFDLDPFPRRLVVVGGGYIACEFASIFNGLGSEVMQLYRGEQVLRGFDNDVRRFIMQEVRKHGVDLRTNSDVNAIEKTARGLEVVLNDGSTVIADTVLYAGGRRPNVAGLGLESAGVAQGEDGAILVDAAYRTSVPSIYAVGDATGRIQLTPVALAEAMFVVDRLFGTGGRQMDYDFIPTAVFTHPNIATVGYSESDARRVFGEISVYRSEFRSLRHALSGSSERTLMKLVVAAGSDRVVGLHMVGADAGEVVQGFAVALKAGATKAVFDRTIGIHPTAAEEFVTMRDPVAADGQA